MSNLPEEKDFINVKSGSWKCASGFAIRSQPYWTAACDFSIILYCMSSIREG